MALPQPDHEAVYEINYIDNGNTMQIVLQQMKGLVNELESDFENQFTNDERIVGWLGQWEIESPITTFDVVVADGLNEEQKQQAFNDAYAFIRQFVLKHWHDY